MKHVWRIAFGLVLIALGLLLAAAIIIVGKILNDHQLTAIICVTVAIAYCIGWYFNSGDTDYF